MLRYTKLAVLVLSALNLVTYAADIPNAWQAITFGQSTDLNFKSTVKPEKIGVNNVWINEGGKPLTSVEQVALPSSFVLESRGGKLANSHDGMVTLVRALPATSTFVLQAEVTLEQLGPEVNGKTPNFQEGVGLFVRDSLGPARQDPQPAGYEEYPHASNMVMNAVMTESKKNDGKIELVDIRRDGVLHPWGNPGVRIHRQVYQKGLNSQTDTKFLLRLERTPTQLILSWQDAQGKRKSSIMEADANGLLNQQDTKHIYVGFFASRNARVTFSNASLQLHPANVALHELPATYQPIMQDKPDIEFASADISAQSEYVLQLRTNYAGKLNIQTGKTSKVLIAKAGEFVTLPVHLQSGENTFVVNSRPTDGPDAGKTIQKKFVVNHVKSPVANPKLIYASTTGVAGNNGTELTPVDLPTAIRWLVPGGTIYLEDGRYSSLQLSAADSGLPHHRKQLKALHPQKVWMTESTSNLDASYWYLTGLVFDGNPDGKLAGNNNAFLRISGSYNELDQITARNNGDTGIWISSQGSKKLPYAYWPAHNLVLNSDSYNNRDISGINADGFAAKLGVGPGNVFHGCISHNNADDGYDLFNKIEDGANAPVTIENSLAYENGLPYQMKDVAKGTLGNGFKLGGEGQPVAHVIKHSIAFNNNMDGFTDNFNTGAMQFKDNISFNNARYNYIIRPNPYTKTSVPVKFEGNLSIRDNWHGAIADYLSSRVQKKQYHVLNATEEQALFESVEVPDTIHRDGKGNIVLPRFLHAKATARLDGQPIVAGVWSH
jgi:hypothetical protein